MAQPTNAAPHPARHPDLDPVVVNAVLIAVRQAANVLCDRWTLLTLLLAHAGVTRFADFRERGGMATRLLSTRLAMLEEQEVMVRMAYTRRPLRHSYHLSHMGLALFDVLASMQAWEQQWHARPVGAGLVIEHQACGARVVAPLARCAACGEPASPRVVDLRINQKEIAAMPARATSYRRSTVSAASGAAERDLPLAHCLDMFGDKWSIEVVMCVFVQARSFGQMQAHTGMSTNILADRLSRLVSSGIIGPVAALAGQRQGAYKLTEKGTSLFPILVAIEAWADHWLRDRLRSPMHLVHRGCGKPLRLQTCCDVCGKALLRHACRMHIA
jgi:DNA-binding HxlR family transcriptional regulator